jgi:beta-glucosidase
MRRLFFMSCMMIASIQFCISQTYKDSAAPVEDRVNDLISKMTLEEKVDMLGGTGFATKPNSRLGIPSLKMTDGPVGVRWGISTAFPASIMLAATWDTVLAGRYGRAIGREVKAKDRNEILGPCICINRVPQGGRNFESYGEDPYLDARIAVAYVKGVQSQHVAATVKHYVTNNQEWERGVINNKVGLRALYEIYLPAFKAAVEEGGAMAVMAAYNKVNGSYCSENKFLLTDVLKGEWKFNGLVMSDWGAVHSTLATANDGLDLEMPTGEYQNKDSLLPLITQGKVKEATIDDRVRRILGVMFRLGLFDSSSTEKPNANDPAQQKVALDVARAGIILLKNENDILPLHMSALKSIAVIGPNAAVARTGGGGSSLVNAASAESPLDALKRMYGDSVKINYSVGVPMQGETTPVSSEFLSPEGGSVGARGLLGEYFTNETLSGEPALRRVDTTVDFDWGEGSPAPGIGVDSFSVRWSGQIHPTETGTYLITVATDDGVRLYIDNQLLVDNWTVHATEAKEVRYEMDAGKSYSIRMEYFENTGGASALLGWTTPSRNQLKEVVTLAKESDVALLFVGDSKFQESEGIDRPSIALPDNQIELINAVAKANPKTVVILEAGAQVTMEDWINNVHGLMDAWYPGQEGAQAIVEALAGTIDPSGKLPVTIPRRWEDCSAYGSYPGLNEEEDYSDGILVGYRHFDTKNIPVRYPFGYGMSYTKFEVSGLRVTAVPGDEKNKYDVTVDVKNAGDVAGAEVVQVYVHDDSAQVLRPTKELKAFTKIFLQPKEKKRVSMRLTNASFAYYDDVKRGWATSKGMYEILVGTSSRDLPLKETLRLH